MLTWRGVDAHEFGQESERVAERYLRRRGYAILERNVRLAEGELDLIVKHGTVLVFVEVKARRSLAMGGAASAVTADKRMRLMRLAAQYLALRRLGDQPCRFDVVLIQQTRLGRATVEHIENAFELPGRDLRW